MWVSMDQAGVGGGGKNCWGYSECGPSYQGWIECNINGLLPHFSP